MVVEGEDIYLITTFFSLAYCRISGPMPFCGIFMFCFDRVPLPHFGSNVILRDFGVLVSVVVDSNVLAVVVVNG